MTNSSAKIFPKGTILIALYGATVGRLAFLGIEASTNQAIAAIFPSSKLNSKFLYWYLFKYREELLAQRIGGAQPNISQFTLKNISIPLPPLTEQLRIVEKLEELFSELDKGIESLTQAKEQIKTYRQAVLKYAFEGRLLKASDTDLKMVAEPKTPYNAMSNLPEEWHWAKLIDVCNKIQDGSHFSPKVTYSKPGTNRYPYLTSKNIRNNYLDLSDIVYVDESFHGSIYDRCNPEYGDVLLTKDGVNTGNVTLNTLEEPFSLLSSVCLLKPNPRKLDSSYLSYYIQSPVGNKNILGSMTGTAIKRIILKQIKESKIIMPSLEEQRRITQEIERRFSEADSMEKTIDRNLQQAEALRQSILKTAFEGRLV